MKINTSYLRALFLAGSAVATGTGMAWGDLLPPQVNSDLQRSGETSRDNSALRRLVVGLSSGAEAVRALRGSEVENNYTKDRLETPIVEMECSIDRIANYVSCYSSPVNSAAEADTLFAKLLYELQIALPSDSWRGVAKKPGIASSRSHSYQDQRSNARIDIDIVARPKAHGPDSYVVSIFGWPGYKLPGYDELGNP